MADKCESCGIGVGPGYEGYPVSYRGRNICGSCLRRWKGLEAEAGGEIVWEEMVKGLRLPNLSRGYRKVK